MISMVRISFILDESSLTIIFQAKFYPHLPFCRFGIPNNQNNKKQIMFFAWALHSLETSDLAHPRTVVVLTVVKELEPPGEGLVFVATNQPKGDWIRKNTHPKWNN